MPKLRKKASARKVAKRATVSKRGLKNLPLNQKFN